MTLVTSQASSHATTSTTSSATSSQPSTSLASAGDGPVTSDAALAALAAEAGLIMPSEGDQNNEQTAGAAAAAQENTDNSALQNSSEGQLGEGVKQVPKAEPGENGEGKRQEGNSINADGSENTIKQEPVDPDGVTEPANPATTTAATGESGDTADPLATLASAAINSSLSTTTPTIKTEEPTPTFTNGLNQETVSVPGIVHSFSKLAECDATLNCNICKTFKCFIYSVSWRKNEVIMQG